MLTDEQLELLRGGAQYSIDKLDAAMDAAGTDRLGINHRGKRYFSSMIYQDRPELRQFLFSDTMAEICRAALGDEAYLFWEQYVIKAGDPDTAFAWHQDSGYVHEDHEPYLTCWIALDDVTEENGSVYLLPYSRSGIRSYIKHIHDPEHQRPGLLLRLRPGHADDRAGRLDRGLLQRRHPPQRRQPTDRNRRVYLAQYSKEVIPAKDGTEPHGSFEPLPRRRPRSSPSADPLPHPTPPTLQPAGQSSDWIPASSWRAITIRCTWLVPS